MTQIIIIYAITIYALFNNIPGNSIEMPDEIISGKGLYNLSLNFIFSLNESSQLYV